MIDFIKPRAITFVGKRGRVFDSHDLLVAKGSRPHGGWSSSIVLNGTKMPLKGNLPIDVIHAFRDLLEKNSIDFTYPCLWTTLNADWLQRSREEHRLISIEDFVRSCTFSSKYHTFRGSVDSSEWVHSIVDSIGFYLCVDEGSYRYDDLIGLVDCAVRMADPTSSRKLGSHVVLASFLAKRDLIRYKPCHLLEEARDWFITVLDALAVNQVITATTREEVTLKYSWDNGTQD